MTSTQWSFSTSIGFVDINLLVNTEHDHTEHTMPYRAGAVGTGLWPQLINPISLPPFFSLPPVLNFSYGFGSGLQGADAAPGTLPHGFACGVMQSDFCEFIGWGPDNITPFYGPGHIAPMNFGLVVMSNVTHISGSSVDGQAYSFCMDSISFGNFFRLYKMNTGISDGTGSANGSSYTLLWSSASASWNQNQWYTLTLFWFSDPYFLKGTWLMGWVGNPFDGTSGNYATDLSDFDPKNLDPSKSTPLFNIVHTGTGAIATQAPITENVYASARTNASAILIRNTKLWKMTPSTINGVVYPPP